MGKSESITVTVAPIIVPPVITELESGRYKYTFHGTKSEFKEIEAIKKAIKERWEQEEGIAVESIEITQITEAEALPQEPVWYDGRYETITEEHTDMVIVFTVSSPFPWAIVILLIMFASGFVAGFLLAGVFDRIVEVVEEFPWIVPLAVGGIVVVAVIAFALMAKEKKPKKPELEG